MEAESVDDELAAADIGCTVFVPELQNPRW